MLLLYHLLTPVPLSNKNEGREKEWRKSYEGESEGLPKMHKPRRVVHLLYHYVLRLVG